MTAPGTIVSGSGPSPVSAGPQHLRSMVRRDQLRAVRRSTLLAIPVNSLLSLANMLIAWRHGEAALGLIWLAISMAVNGLRAGHWLATGHTIIGDDAPDAAIERRLREAWLLTLLSGMAWALVPMLCGGYTAPETSLYLIIGCGITAGAVTHGTAYARVPIAFITPPLFSAIACLALAGGFDHRCLAATIALYFAALAPTARQAEAAFRRTSRLTHEARSMALSLGAAHAQSVAVAEQLRHRATHDPLTGLLNRDGLLQEEPEGWHRPGADTLCLMLLDLDGFKAINDAFGHQAGDAVLIEVARRLRMMLPADMTIVRLGGDEFAILYRLGLHGEPPSLLASRLIAGIGLPYAGLDAARVGVSIGIQVAQGADIAELLSCADEALYAAKRAGRNRHYLFDDILRGRLDMRRDVERDMSRALTENALEVWFQPIFGDAGRQLLSLEALIRWKHPQHGWIAPAELIATAASAGFAERLMIFILRNVCDMIDALQRSDLGHIGVAMNISPREMAQLPVDELILSALAARRLPAAMMEIEITEETALDIAGVRQKLAALSSAGIRIAIDDFGVGYSTLASLRQLKVDRVKIDRCFVSGLAGSPGDQVVVQAVLNLGRSLGFEVIAEGVETIDDLRILRDLGCDYMQGYHLGRPANRAATLSLLARGAAIAAH